MSPGHAREVFGIASVLVLVAGLLGGLGGLVIGPIAIGQFAVALFWLQRARIGDTERWSEAASESAVELDDAVAETPIDPLLQQACRSGRVSGYADRR